MSASLINRSLTTIRTELDFLLESNVIDNDVYNRINESLPQRYNANQSRSSVSSAAGSNSGQEYVEAIYDFPPQQDGDLELHVGDKVEVLEKPSAEWYKGRCNGKTGMFPSNYVKPAFSTAGQNEKQRAPAPPQYNGNSDNNSSRMEKQYTNSSNQSSYQQQQQQPYPPPSTNYYQQPPPQQQVVYQQAPQQQPQQVIVQQQPQQQSNGSSQMKKFGSKLGNAAIFGAGATLGSDLVNSIF